MNPNKIFPLIIILVIGISLVLLKSVFLKELARFDFDFFKSTPVLLEKLNPVLSEQHPHIIGKSVDIRLIINLNVTDESYEINDSDFYYLIEQFGKATGSIIIGNKTETTEESLEIPNLMNNEYDRLRLERQDNGSIYLISDVYIKIGENYHNVQSKSEIFFIEGDWDTFISGGNIVMRYTEHALKELASKLASLMEKYDQEKLVSSVCKGRCSNLSLTVTKISNATITINKKMIRMKYDGPTEIRGSFKVKSSKVHNESSISLVQATR